MFTINHQVTLKFTIMMAFTLIPSNRSYIGGAVRVDGEGSEGKPHLTLGLNIAKQGAKGIYLIQTRTGNRDAPPFSYAKPKKLRLHHK